MTVDPAAPRILLFGHPGSGKSSLLGALHRAGETQLEQLGTEVIDPSGRLPRISQHIYAGTPLERTQTELVTYELRLKHGANQPAQTAVIHDCDGNAANALLKHPDPITERDVRGLVASAVVQADLLALVVNAGAADEEERALFDHPADLAMRQRERLPQRVGTLRRRQNVERLFRARLICPSVEDQFALRGRERAQLQAAGGAVKERVVLSNDRGPLGREGGHSLGKRADVGHPRLYFDVPGHRCLTPWR